MKNCIKKFCYSVNLDLDHSSGVYHLYLLKISGIYLFMFLPCFPDLIGSSIQAGTPLLQVKGQELLSGSQILPIDKMGPEGLSCPLPSSYKWSSIGTQPSSFIYISAAIVLQWQKWVVVAEIPWPTEPRLCAPWTFTEKVCQHFLQTEVIIPLTVVWDFS